MVEVRAPERDTRPLSRYARKQQELAEGRRAPFEFREHKAEPTEPPPRAIPTDTTWPQTLCATVERLCFHRGCLFLALEDGTPVFMQMKTLQQGFGKIGARVGIELECLIEPHPNGKGLHAFRILRTVSA